MPKDTIEKKGPCEREPSEAMQKRFQQFLDYPNQQQIKTILRTYIDNCIPDPRQTACHRWAMSCFPSTETLPRVSAISLHTMESLVIHSADELLDKDSYLVGFINIAASEFFGRFDPIVFREKYPNTDLCFPVIYEDAKREGIELVNIAFGNLDDMERAVNAPYIQNAAQILNRSVMMKRTLQKRGHNKPFTEYILG